MDVIGVGFLGCGDISTLHAQAIAKLEGARLVGLWNYREEDISAGGTSFTATGRAATHGCMRFDSAESLLADASISAVFVLTNMETHLQYVRMALEAGKHVLVEKPVGVTLEEIEAMQTMAAAKGLCCVPGHNCMPLCVEQWSSPHLLLTRSGRTATQTSTSRPSSACATWWPTAPSAS